MSAQFKKNQARNGSQNSNEGAISHKNSTTYTEASSKNTSQDKNRGHRSDTKESRLALARGMVTLKD